MLTKVFLLKILVVPLFTLIHLVLFKLALVVKAGSIVGTGVGEALLAAVASAAAWSRMAVAVMVWVDLSPEILLGLMASVLDQRSDAMPSLPPSGL